MVGRNRPGDLEDPDELFRPVNRVRLSVSHVVKGGLGIEAQLGPNAVRHQSVEPGALVDLIEVRQGLALVEDAPITGGLGGRTVDIIE